MPRSWPAAKRWQTIRDCISNLPDPVDGKPTDGVTNHVTFSLLKEMLQSEATSAEMAARRLVNLTNIEGATDNATVVVVRVT